MGAPDADAGDRRHQIIERVRELVGNTNLLDEVRRERRRCERRLRRTVEASEEAQRRGDVGPGRLTIARHAPDTIVAHPDDHRLDAPLDFHFDRQAPDRALLSGRGHRPQVANHGVTQPSGHRPPPLS